MRRLIGGFAGRIYHIVGNLMHWLQYLHAAKAVASLSIYTDSQEPSLLDKPIYLFILVLSVSDAMFKAKEVRRLLKLMATRKGPFAKPIRRRMPLEWKLKNIVSSKKLKRRHESHGGIDEHKVHLKPEEQNRILWVCQYAIYNKWQV